MRIIYEARVKLLSLLEKKGGIENAKSDAIGIPKKLGLFPPLIYGNLSICDGIARRTFTIPTCL